MLIQSIKEIEILNQSKDEEGLEDDKLLVEGMKDEDGPPINKPKPGEGEKDDGGEEDGDGGGDEWEDDDYDDDYDYDDNDNGGGDYDEEI